jgi:hypothetical protein
LKKGKQGVVRCGFYLALAVGPTQEGFLTLSYGFNLKQSQGMCLVVVLVPKACYKCMNRVGKAGRSPGE